MSSTTSKLVAAAALAALAVGSAGCAGDDAPEASPRANTPGSFTDRANEVLCDARHDVAADALRTVLGGDDPTPEEARRKFLPAYLEIRDGLEKLNPPAPVAERFAEVLTGLDGAIAVVSADPSRLLSDDDPFAPTETKMAAIGLDGCA